MQHRTALFLIVLTLAACGKVEQPAKTVASTNDPAPETEDVRVVGDKAMKFTDRDPEATAAIKCKQYFDAAKIWRVVHKKYPSTLEEMQAPLRPGEKNHIELENDPWGNPYKLELEGDRTAVWSCGPDGKKGTEDDLCYPNLIKLALARLRCNMRHGDVEAWKRAHGEYPASLEDVKTTALDALLPPDLVDDPIESDTDPWGNPYRLEVKDGKARVWSNGPDGKQGTEDDICHPELEKSPDNGKDK